MATYLVPEGTTLLPDFGNSFFAQMTLLDGDFYCQNGDPIYLFYHDDGAENFDYSMPCGMAEDDATSVTITEDLTPGSGATDYLFTRRGVSPAGSIGEASDTITISIDDSGVMQASAGNEPGNINVTAIAGGKYRVTWTYNPDNQVAAPTGFRVYWDDSGTWSQIGYKLYRPGRLRYVYTTDAYGHGTTNSFLVRTYRTVGETTYITNNDTGDSAIADATGPSAITDLTVSST